MEHSLLASRKFILKHKIYSKEGERKLKRLLQSIQGVHSVEINAKQGTITISGTIDPPTIMTMLEQYGRKAELLWDQKPAKDGDGSLQIIAESKVVDQLDDPKMVEKLEQLSGIKDLKKIEVAYSKTITLTFNGKKNERKMEGIDMEATSKDTMNGKKNERKMKGIDMEATSKDIMNGTQLFHGGRPCVASASCCGGHGVHNVHGHHGCCQINTTCPIQSRACAIHNNNWNWPPPACGCMSQPEPAPSWPANYSPSAPPLPTVYDQPSAPPPPPPPQPIGYSYSSMFSDDNVNGYCVIM